MSAPAIDDDREAGPAERLDEAFALLRAMPFSAVVWWIVGAAPMVLCALFFWADMSRGGVPDLPAPVWAAILALAYVWMKIAQARMARALWDRLVPDGGLPELGAGQWFRRTGALLLLSAISLPAVAVAMQLLIPFAWVFSFFHHATVLAYTHDLGPRPLRAMVRLCGRLSHREPLAHHFCLLLFLVLGGMVWGAVFVLGLLLPFLLKILTGVESQFTLNPLATAFNSLYLAVTVSVAWMVISPYIRVFYVLRTFHDVSRRTGDDLLARLHAARQRTQHAAAALLLAGLSLAMLPAAAEEAPGGPSPQGSDAVATAPAAAVVAAAGDPAAAGTPDAAPLAQAIRETLEARDYQWRLPVSAEAGDANAENSVLAALRRALQMVRDVVRRVDDWVSNVERFVRRWLGKGDPGSAGAGGEGASAGSVSRVLLVLLAGAVLVGAIVLFRRMSRRRTAPRPASSVVEGASADLADENTLASALPGDDWLRLARMQWEAGDLRLAVRAVYLATLAALGEQGLLVIARSKSNRDYLTELRYRAASRRDAPEVFGRSVALFERAWYGLHPAAPEWVKEMLDNHDRLNSRAPAA